MRRITDQLVGIMGRLGRLNGRGQRSSKENSFKDQSKF